MFTYVRGDSMVAIMITTTHSRRVET